MSSQARRSQIEMLIEEPRLMPLIRKVLIFAIFAVPAIGLVGKDSVQHSGTVTPTNKTQPSNASVSSDNLNRDSPSALRRIQTNQQPQSSTGADVNSTDPGKEMNSTSLPKVPRVRPRGDVAKTEGPFSDIDPETLRELKKHISVLPDQSAEPSFTNQSAKEDEAERNARQVNTAGNGLVSPLAPSPTVSFAGPSNADQSTQWTPPNPNIAAGPNHIMVAVNSQFAIYSKSGTLLSKTTFSSWLAGVCSGCSSAGYFDPRLTYDPVAGRW